MAIVVVAFPFRLPIREDDPMRLRSYAITALGLGLSVSFLTLTHTGVALADMAKPLLVQVVSTSAEPVNVTGSTSITGSVAVGNTAANPVLMRNVDNPATRLFQTGLCVADNASCDSVGDTFSVPANERLVIEFVSGHCASLFEGMLIGLTTSVAGQVLTHPLHAAARTGVSIFAYQTRIYADEGSNVVLSQFDVGDLTSVCQVTISGHFVSP
jgi:hypothetical protein